MLVGKVKVAHMENERSVEVGENGFLWKLADKKWVQKPGPPAGKGTCDAQKSAK